jgi:molybdopterin/thiamine biosynthesis adenylyltransferase
MKLLESIKFLNIVQIGCGGTGSWLAPHLLKFLSNINQIYNEERTNVYIEYNLIDNDIVDVRNILRQNFDYEDILEYKVNSISKRFINLLSNFNTHIIRIETFKEFKKILIKSQIRNLHEFITLDEKNNLIIIFGCTDNIKTRTNIFKWCKKIPNPIIYLDSGNELDSGQIISQTFNLEKIEYLDKPLFENYEKYKKQKDNFLKLFKERKDSINQSCAYFGDQSQSINNLAAAYLFTIFQNLIINNKLPQYNIFFNLNGYSFPKIMNK